MSKFVHNGLNKFFDGQIISDDAATSLSSQGGTSFTSQQLVENIDTLLATNEGYDVQDKKDRNAIIFTAQYLNSVSFLVFATAALAQAYNYVDKKDGLIVFIETYRAYFRLDKINSLTAVPNEILAAGSFYLERLPFADKSWQSKTSWYIDPANSTGLASDENPGDTALLPLRTWNEFYLRLGAPFGATLPTTGDTTVYIMSSGIEIRGIFNGNYYWNFYIEGIPVNDTTDIVVGTVSPVASSNTRGTFTGTTINFSARTQKIIKAVCTGGTTECWSVVQKDLGASACNTPKFVSQASLALGPVPSFVNTNPTVGSTFSVISCPTVNSLYLIVSGPVNTIFKYLDFTSLTDGYASFAGDVFGAAVACYLSLGLIDCSDAPKSILNYIGCCFKGSSIPLGCAGVYGGSSFANISLNNLGNFVANSFELQGKVFQEGYSSTNGARLIVASGINSTGSSGGSIGVWDAAVAFTISEKSVFYSASAAIPYGSNNTKGMLVRKGGVLHYTSGSVPSITGTTELDFNSTTPAIPPLTAGAAVPAASALTTWAQLGAAPFNGSVVDYTDLTSITKV